MMAEGVAEGDGDWVGGGCGKRLRLVLVSGSSELEVCVPMMKLERRGSGESLGVCQRWRCLLKTLMAGLVRTRQKCRKASHSHRQMAHLNCCPQCRHRCSHPRN